MGSLRKGNHSQVPTNTGGSGLEGIRLFSGAYSPRLVFPDFQGQQYPTTVRIVPNIEVDDKGKRYFTPYRHDFGPNGIENWRIRLPVANRVGTDKQQTFVCYDPLEALEDSEVIENNPYAVLYRAIKREIKADHTIKAAGKRIDTAAWSVLMPGNNVKMPCFIKPDTMFTFVSVLSIWSNGRLRYNDETGRPYGAGENEPPSILQLKSSAGDDLEKLANLPNDEDSEWSEGQEYGDYYRYGDFTDPDGGLFIVICVPSKISPDAVTKEGSMTAAAEEEDEEEYSPTAKKKGDKKDMFPPYELFPYDQVWLPTEDKRRPFKPNLDGRKTGDWSPNILANYPPLIDMFDAPENDKIAKYLAMAFKSRPELLEVGFADHPDYMTAEVRGILKSRAQVLVPGATQAGDEEEADDELGDEEEIQPRRSAAGKAGKAGKAASKAGKAASKAVYGDVDDDEEIEDLLGDDEELEDEELEEEEEDEEEDDADEVDADELDDDELEEIEEEDEELEEEEDEEDVAAEQERLEAELRRRQAKKKQLATAGKKKVVKRREPEPEPEVRRTKKKVKKSTRPSTETTRSSAPPETRSTKKKVAKKGQQPAAGKKKTKRRPIHDDDIPF